MKNLTLIATLSSLVAGSALAQNPSTLLLSPKGDETTRSGSGGTVLREIGHRAVGVVTPAPDCVHSAEKFAPGLGFQTLVGDEDGDGDVHTPDLTGGIDATLVLPYQWDQQNQVARPRQRPVNVLEMYVSPVRNVGTFVSGAPGLRKGDCGMVTRTPAGNGQVRYFIRAEQIIESLGLFDPQTQQHLEPHEINLDGITVDRDRNIFLTLEDDHAMRVLVNGALQTFALEDGAIAMIPAAAWTPNARGEVAAVAAQLGLILANETRVDTLVANAKVADNTGFCPSQIGDTDALAIDPNGGGYRFTWGNQVFQIRHLLFAGETLTGAGVLTTSGNGNIAVVNGCPLATSCGAGVTSGEQMGLFASGSVKSLDGLDTLAEEPCRFVLGSPTPTGLGGPIEVHVGTNMPVPAAFLFFGLGVLPVSPSINFAGIMPGTRCFPELYPAILGNPAIMIPLVNDGWGGRVGVFGPIVAPVIAQGILFQAAAVAGGAVQLSTPVTLH